MSKKDDHSEAEEAATVAADVTEATAEVTADEAAAEDTAAETDAVAAAGTETEIDRTRLYSQLFAFLFQPNFYSFS